MEPMKVPVIGGGIGGLASAQRPQIGDTAMQDVKLQTMSHSEITPDHIMRIGMGFWASKALLSAVELGVFTCLAGGSKTGRELERALDLDPRGTYDFLDALVALGLLARDGDGVAGRYRNTAETAVFLDRESPQYIGGILEMANARLYRFWADLTPALKTGKPQNEIKHSDLIRAERTTSWTPLSHSASSRATATAWRADTATPPRRQYSSIARARNTSAGSSKWRMRGSTGSGPT